MKYKTSKQKPPTGMEMTVTLSMPAGQDVQQCADALVRFMEGVTNLSAGVGSAWVKIHCAGIPEELEDRLAAAIEPAPPRLQLVVNNEPR